MRRIVPADPAKPQPVRTPPQARRGQPDSSRTPPACRTARPPQAGSGSRQARDADASISLDWLSCTCRSRSRSGLPGGSLTRSGSVLMNSPTMLSMPAISGGRPATVTPNTTSSRPRQPAEQHSPGRLHERVERQPLPRACSRQRRGQRLAQRQRDLLGRDRRAAASAAGASTRRLLQPAKASRQAAMRSRAILRREPGQIIAIRRHRAAAPRHRRRAHKASAAPAPAPASTSRPSGCDGWSAPADAARRTSRISVKRSSGGAARSNRSARSCGRNSARRCSAPASSSTDRSMLRHGARTPAHDDLHRPAQALMLKARPQARMAPTSSLRRRLQRSPRRAAPPSPSTSCTV